MLEGKADVAALLGQMEVSEGERESNNRLHIAHATLNIKHQTSNININIHTLSHTHTARTRHHTNIASQHACAEGQRGHHSHGNGNGYAGGMDEWSRMQTMPSAVKQWANKVQAVGEQCTPFSEIKSAAAAAAAVAVFCCCYDCCSCFLLWRLL